MKTHLLATALIAALAAAPCAAARPAASGTVTADGTTWQVADAVATAEDGDVEIWFSKLEFDRAAWADDGKFESFDTYDFKGGEDGPALRIDVDEEDNSYGGHTYRSSASSSSGGFSSELETGVTITARDEKHVAGTVKFDDGAGLAADIAFDLPITATGPLARAGTPLPADGGAPGKALRAMVEATHAGDLDAMIALSHPDKRQGIEQARAAGEADEMLKMAQLFTPKISRITGGSTDGDQAWIDFEGTEEGATVKGSAELTRAQGKWYVKGINTKSGG
jgi:hypothetical protein